MNISVYAFGQFEMGYSQYPDDYTGDIFTEFYKHSKAKTQIAIHRDGSLMYYGYIRKLEQNRYIGLCAVVNGQMLTSIDNLFAMFENVFTSMVAQGQLVQLDGQGNIITRASSLYLDKNDIDQLTVIIQAALERQRMQQLPPISYGVANDSIIDFSIKDNVQDIIGSTSKFGYTYIYKPEGYDTAELKTYQGNINRLNQQNSELQKSQKNLNNTNEKLHQINTLLNSCNSTLNWEKDQLIHENEWLQKENSNLKARSEELARQLDLCKKQIRHLFKEQEERAKERLKEVETLQPIETVQNNKNGNTDSSPENPSAELQHIPNAYNQQELHKTPGHNRQGSVSTIEESIKTTTPNEVKNTTSTVSNTEHPNNKNEIDGGFIFFLVIIGLFIILILSLMLGIKGQ